MKHFVMLKQTNSSLSLFILMLAAIIFVTAELVPVGILPEISSSLHYQVGTIGLIITGYAWTVTLSAVLITAYFSIWERRKLLLSIMIVFAVANLAVANATSLPILFLGRILGALSHGIFWASVGGLCVKLANNLSVSRATAIVFGGIAVATVFAVPTGTLIAQYLGWRAVFDIISLGSVLVTILIYFNFPKIPGQTNNQWRHIPETFRHPLLRYLFPATVLAITGHFCAFTYISLLLQKIIKIPNYYLAIYLFLFGIAGVIGNIIAGMLKDQQLLHASILAMLSLSIAIIMCIYLPSNAFITTAVLIAIWGIGICILTVSLQSLILTLPKSIVDTASAIHVSMFNAGIGAGAFLGGIIIDKLHITIVAETGSLLLFVAAIILIMPLNKYSY